MVKNRISLVKRGDDFNEFLSLDEAAVFLGMSSKTLAKKATAGIIPAINIGEPGGRRYWRFSRTALEAWMRGAPAF